MAPKYVASVEIEYTIEDQRQGVSTTTTKLIEKEGAVYIPGGTYGITDVLDAMNLLLHGPNKTTFSGPGKRGTQNFNDQ